MINIETAIQQICKSLHAIKPQDPGLDQHLQTTLKNQTKTYPKKETLYDIGSPTTHLIFLIQGHLIDSVFNKRGDKQTLLLYNPGEIKATPDFIKNKPSKFYTEATPNTTIAYLSYQQLRDIHKQFPPTTELIAQINADNLNNATENLISLHQKGINRVAQFYKTNSQLLPPGNILTDAEISTLLLLSEGALRRLRTQLINKKVLPDYRSKLQST